MTDELVLLKILLGLTDSSKDDILNFYLIKAKNSIKKYCVLTEAEYLLLLLINQTVELAMFYYVNKKNLGVKNASEGSKSKTFEEGIPASIKITLPLPPIFSM